MPITKVCFRNDYEWQPVFCYLPRHVYVDNSHCYYRCWWVWIERRRQESWGGCWWEYRLPRTVQPWRS